MAPLTGGLDARVWQLHNRLPGRFASGGGAMPPDDLARVGAGTPLDRAYGHRLPRPFSSRVGRELRPGQRGAGRSSHRFAVAP
ncbi:hypothetical protein GCM10007935_09590 [Hydrogenophaga electricum]|uniref:Uncharacterized protein n=1 Tax=Hydrogenophaga electricum TaxID=1230953 RepID=A0ABQ6C3G4_9BURK|nr:hypothetical protein GCM10007935_09590 [Hydrogenophaga electricum]